MKTLVMMLVIVVIPVCLGMAINRAKPALAKRVEPFINAFSSFVLIGLIVLIVVTEWENLPTWIAACWQPVLALNIGAIVLGFVISRLTGLSARDAVTVTVEMSIKNTTIGFTIALTLLQSTELAIPASVYSLFMYGSVVMLAAYGRYLARKDGA